jgi:hypothetical protein
MIDRESRQEGADEARSGEAHADQGEVAGAILGAADAAGDPLHGNEEEVERGSEQKRREIQRCDAREDRGQ